MDFKVCSKIRDSCTHWSLSKLWTQDIIWLAPNEPYWFTGANTALHLPEQVFKAPYQSPYSWDLCINIIFYFLPENGSLLLKYDSLCLCITYNFIQFMCICWCIQKTSWVCGWAFLWENQKYLTQILQKATAGFEGWHQPFNINCWSFSDM